MTLFVYTSRTCSFLCTGSSVVETAMCSDPPFGSEELIPSLLGEQLADSRLVGARGWEQGVAEMGGGGRMIQISTYKINKSWGRNLQHEDNS